MLGVPISELLWLALAIMIGGVATGILAGLFGIGGGAVIVPVLYEVFRILDVPDEVRMQLCVGTSLAIIVPTTIRSYLAHRARGAVLEDVVRAWAVPAVVGVAIGSIVAAFAPSAVFKLAFVVVAVFVGAKFLFGRDTWRIATELPGRAAMSAYGLLVGLSSSLMGVSGGSVSNIVQTLYGIPIHKAVATSAGLGVPITVAGTLGYMLAGLPHQAQVPPLSIGFVSLIGVAVMAPVSSFTATYGARLAHALPRRRLEIAFGVFLLLVAARFIASLMW
ncbi:MAG TPA: sulfite exporter TauE/SafE family protein [Xanthobacteraceae bacterium]|nr:sulfite exporter TauE/SafE family protein [Xanthobacteraceae bacterium]